MTFILSLGQPGPLLAELLEAQRREEKLVAYPLVEQVAQALIARAAELGGPLIWPVGGAAERVAGAAVVVSAGTIRVAGWNLPVNGDEVLLFTVAATTPLGLLAAAEEVKRLGARSVHACGVDVAGITDATAWDTFSHLRVCPEGSGLRAAPLLASA
jgi:hypothetical protein